MLLTLRTTFLTLRMTFLTLRTTFLKSRMAILSRETLRMMQNPCSERRSRIWVAMMWWVLLD